MRRSRMNYICYSILFAFSFILLAFYTHIIIEGNWNISYEERNNRLITTKILLWFLYNCIRVYLTLGRLMDMGKSPKWSWLVFIPFVWFYFACAKGTDGDNQYGKSPKDLQLEEKIKQAEQQALTNPTDIDLVLQNMEQFCSPNIGRIESINFRMNEENERYFYAIPPGKVKKLRQRLEIIAKRLQDDENCYGYLYAERRFYIGNKLMFSWSNEVKI